MRPVVLPRCSDLRRLKSSRNVFCRALADSLSTYKQRIAAYRKDGKALDVFVDIQQLFGDVFICAGYFLGHLDGLGLSFPSHTPRASALLAQQPQIGGLVQRLRRTLHELWLSEYGWSSIEVFAPIYDILCAMMALHGFVFARTDAEWRVVMCECDGASRKLGAQRRLLERTEWAVAKGNKANYLPRLECF